MFKELSKNIMLFDRVVAGANALRYRQHDSAETAVIHFANLAFVSPQNHIMAKKCDL